MDKLINRFFISHNSVHPYSRPLAVLTAVIFALVFGFGLPRLVPVCSAKTTEREILSNCRLAILKTMEILQLTIENHYLLVPEKAVLHASVGHVVPVQQEDRSLTENQTGSRSGDSDTSSSDDDWEEDETDDTGDEKSAGSSDCGALTDVAPEEPLLAAPAARPPPARPAPLHDKSTGSGAPGPSAAAPLRATELPGVEQQHSFLPLLPAPVRPGELAGGERGDSMVRTIHFPKNTEKTGDKLLAELFGARPLGRGGDHDEDDLHDDPHTESDLTPCLSDPGLDGSPNLITIPTRKAQSCFPLGRMSDLLGVGNGRNNLAPISEVTASPTASSASASGAVGGIAFPFPLPYGGSRDSLGPVFSPEAARPRSIIGAVSPTSSLKSLSSPSKKMHTSSNNPSKEAVRAIAARKGGRAALRHQVWQDSDGIAPPGTSAKAIKTVENVCTTALADRKCGGNERARNKSKHRNVRSRTKVDENSRRREKSRPRRGRGGPQGVGTTSREGVPHQHQPLQLLGPDGRVLVDNLLLPQGYSRESIVGGGPGPLSLTRTLTPLARNSSGALALARCSLGRGVSSTRNSQPRCNLEDSHSQFPLPRTAIRSRQASITGGFSKQGLSRQGSCIGVEVVSGTEDGTTATGGAGGPGGSCRKESKEDEVFFQMSIAELGAATEPESDVVIRRRWGKGNKKSDNNSAAMDHGGAGGGSNTALPTTDAGRRGEQTQPFLPPTAQREKSSSESDVDESQRIVRNPLGLSPHGVCASYSSFDELSEDEALVKQRKLRSAPAPRRASKPRRTSPGRVQAASKPAAGRGAEVLPPPRAPPHTTTTRRSKSRPARSRSREHPGKLLLPKTLSHTPRGAAARGAAGTSTAAQKHFSTEASSATFFCPEARTGEGEPRGMKKHKLERTKSKQKTIPDSDWDAAEKIHLIREQVLCTSAASGALKRIAEQQGVENIIGGPQHCRGKGGGKPQAGGKQGGGGSSKAGAGGEVFVGTSGGGKMTAKGGGSSSGGAFGGTISSKGWGSSGPIDAEHDISNVEVGAHQPKTPRGGAESSAKFVKSKSFGPARSAQQDLDKEQERKKQLWNKLVPESDADVVWGAPPAPSVASGDRRDRIINYRRDRDHRMKDRIKDFGARGLPPCRQERSQTTRGGVPRSQSVKSRTGEVKPRLDGLTARGGAVQQKEGGHINLKKFRSKSREQANKSRNKFQPKTREGFQTTKNTNVFSPPRRGSGGAPARRGSQQHRFSSFRADDFLTRDEKTACLRLSQISNRSSVDKNHHDHDTSARLHKEPQHSHGPGPSAQDDDQIEHLVRRSLSIASDRSSIVGPGIAPLGRSCSGRRARLSTAGSARFSADSLDGEQLLLPKTRTRTVQFGSTDQVITRKELAEGVDLEIGAPTSVPQQLLGLDDDEDDALPPEEVQGSYEERRGELEHEVRELLRKNKELQYDSKTKDKIFERVFCIFPFLRKIFSPLWKSCCRRRRSSSMAGPSRRKMSDEAAPTSSVAQHRTGTTTTHLVTTRSIPATATAHKAPHHTTKQSPYLGWFNVSRQIRPVFSRTQGIEPPELHIALPINDLAKILTQLSCCFAVLLDSDLQDLRGEKLFVGDVLRGKRSVGRCGGGSRAGLSSSKHSADRRWRGRTDDDARKPLLPISAKDGFDEDFDEQVSTDNEEAAPRDRRKNFRVLLPSHPSKTSTVGSTSTGRGWSSDNRNGPSAVSEAPIGVLAPPDSSIPVYDHIVFVTLSHLCERLTALIELAAEWRIIFLVNSAYMRKNLSASASDRGLMWKLSFFLMNLSLLVRDLTQYALEINARVLDERGAREASGDRVGIIRRRLEEILEKVARTHDIEAMG